MSKIQDDADEIIKASQTQMQEVMKEQDEHGAAITFYKGMEGNVWGYEDRFKKTIKR